MGRALGALLAASTLLGVAACGAADRVEQYPTANAERERETEGERDPVQRSLPPEDRSGPQPPQNELAGEDTEPL